MGGGGGRSTSTSRDRREGWDGSAVPAPAGFAVFDHLLEGCQLIDFGGRIRHLNAVLRGVRAVNQIITRERDPERLAQQAWAPLIESRGHPCCAVVRVENGRPVRATSAGDPRRLYGFHEMVARGELPA